MSVEINTIIAAALADQDGLLSDAVHMRVSPELKEEWKEDTTRRRKSF